MVTPTIFLLAIDCKKKKCSVFNTLDFYVFVTPRVLKIENFFFFQLIANKKNNRGYHIPMIDLGESEKVTAVFKLVLNFFTMVRSDLDFLVNIFEKRSFWCFK